MRELNIREHTMASWVHYKDAVGFVPDPMILRAGEIFLNGRSGSRALDRNDSDVWNALQANAGGLFDFFDIVVSRDTIPLINYGDTFDRRMMESPLDELLKQRLCRVEIEYGVYHAIKAGALKNLANLDLSVLDRFAHVLQELNAFRYDWTPALAADSADPEIAQARAKFANVQEPTRSVLAFLLGGFIFSGFAQASGTMHYIQPKRSRFFLGLTAAPDKAGGLSSKEEVEIFDSAEARLKGTKAQVQRTDPVPPVLPYLLADGGEPKSARELLDRALAFRDNRHGRVFRGIVDDIREDGVQARRAEDAAAQARREAQMFLAPYGRLDTSKSRSLEITLSSEAVGVPGGEVTFPLGVPRWLRIWWNDNVPFGGVHKTLRQMWMAAESYNDLMGKLRSIWARS
jgi:hypothetical protein